MLIGPHKGVMLKGYKVETEGASVALKGELIVICLPSGSMKLCDVVESPNVTLLVTQIK